MTLETLKKLCAGNYVLSKKTVSDADLKAFIEGIEMSYEILKAIENVYGALDKKTPENKSSEVLK